MRTVMNRSGGRPYAHARLLHTAGWSAMLLALSTPAWAQDQLHAPPPNHFTLDERGVDLIDRHCKRATARRGAYLVAI